MTSRNILLSLLSKVAILQGKCFLQFLTFGFIQFCRLLITVIEERDEEEYVAKTMTIRVGKKQIICNREIIHKLFVARSTW